MAPYLDRLQRSMPLLRSVPEPVWSYSQRILPCWHAAGAWERGWEGGFSRASGRII